MLPHSIVLFAAIISQHVCTVAVRPREDPKAPEQVSPVSESRPAAPPVLAPVDGAENGSAERRTEEAISSMLGRLDQATSKPEKVQLALAAANLILSRGIEPGCSGLILELQSGEASKGLEEPLDRARDLLTTARATLDREESGGGNAEEWRPQAVHRLETLEAFHAGLSAYLLRTDDTRAARRAASRLSPLLEDPNRSVAAAATFWQACLRSVDTDTSRAMSVLDLALSDIRADDLPYAFFARLMRCRLIARAGGPAAAIALLLQMEERCHDWFLEETGRRDAVRTIHLTRAQILRGWKLQMADGEDQAARDWIDERLRQIETEIFREGENTVTRLRPVIPLIAIAPPPSNAPPPAESEPADAPTDTP